MKREGSEVLEGKRKLRALFELLVILVLAFAVYLLSSFFDILERIVEISRQYEYLELDEIITVFIFLVFAMLFFSLRRWAESRRSEELLSQRNAQLEKAFTEVRQLRGIIPICSVCKKVRDDEGFWQQVESYVSEHTEAEFTHGICPDCIQKLYPDIAEDMINIEDRPDR